MRYYTNKRTPCSCLPCRDGHQIFEHIPVCAEKHFRDTAQSWLLTLKLLTDKMTATSTVFLASLRPASDEWAAGTYESLPSGKMPLEYQHVHQNLLRTSPFPFIWTKPLKRVHCCITWLLRSSFSAANQVPISSCSQRVHESTFVVVREAMAFLQPVGVEFHNRTGSGPHVYEQDQEIKDQQQRILEARISSIATKAFQNTFEIRMRDREVRRSMHIIT